MLRRIYELASKLKRKERLGFGRIRRVNPREHFAKFCLCLRDLLGQDDACHESDEHNARRVFAEALEDPQGMDNQVRGYLCQAGLIDQAAVMLCYETPVAVVLSGQFFPGDTEARRPISTRIDELAQKYHFDAKRKGEKAVLDDIWPVLNGQLVQPVADRLKELGYQQAVLIPSGTLSLLPLHAVALEQIAFGYIPSARAMHTVYRDEDHVDVPAALLGVGNPASYNQQPLAFARLEVEEISALFTQRELDSAAFYEDTAVRKDVLAALPGTTHLHFSCHGTFDVDNPLDSALYLAGDDTLTLRDLLDGGLDVSAARVAVLSACQTGITDFQNVPDEAVGFPAGFIQVGVPGVISTLWPVNEVSTALLLKRFYQYHLEEGLEPAVALNKAQGWLRDATAGEMELAEYYERLFLASGRHDPNILKAMRHYRAKPEPDVKPPFAHPYYWAAFVFSGV